METTLEVKYSPGDQVKVRAESHPGHHRTPWFIKGKTGRVSAARGAFHDPETRAYSGSGLPKQPLYTVEFDQTIVWDGYTGTSNDKLLIDIYQHWLEPA